jgi:hypothetical protein
MKAVAAEKALGIVHASRYGEQIDERSAGRVGRGANGAIVLLGKRVHETARLGEDRADPNVRNAAAHDTCLRRYCTDAAQQRNV